LSKNSKNFKSINSNGLDVQFSYFKYWKKETKRKIPREIKKKREEGRWKGEKKRKREQKMYLETINLEDGLEESGSRILSIWM
jgi:hypothetical protein